jgi:hypothetical protein
MYIKMHTVEIKGKKTKCTELSVQMGFVKKNYNEIQPRIQYIVYNTHLGMHLILANVTLAAI